MDDENTGTTSRVLFSIPSIGMAILLTMCLLAFIAWASMSSVYVVSAQKAISHTTVLCTERLITEIELRNALKKENDALHASLLVLQGRLETFENLYDITKAHYESKQKVETRVLGGKD